MKKIAIVIMVLCTIGLAGGLYSTLAHLDTRGQETTGYSDVMQFPCALPDISLSPPTIPLY